MIAEVLQQPVAAFVEMFHDPRSRWFTLYLITSLAIAWGVYRRQARRDPEVRALGFIGFVFPGEIYGHASAKLDYWFYVFNKLAFAGIFAGTVVIAQASSWLTLGAAQVLVAEPPLTGHPVLALVVTTVFYALAMDFGLWLGHYLCHRVPLLWEFHKVHHSVEVLTPASAGRVHPLDDLLSYSLGGIMGGMASGLCHAAFGADAAFFAAFQLHIVLFAFYVLGFHLRHSHVWLPYTGWLGHVLISPAHHQVHHSSEERHWDRNMGFIFALWDWMFGTLYVPAREPETFKLGIGGEEKEFNSLGRLYCLPLVKAWRRLRGAAPDPKVVAGHLGFADVDAAADENRPTAQAGATLRP
ncbi:MAG TPA: sterol desaturase family protein [Microvirga sp.]|jgi:sterol desaturase/sphingolipid hydroxylase (fatty acid hydroxylase superfamily)|nr:sterol desaturase family protein [Microvirga sp.]